MEMNEVKKLDEIKKLSGLYLNTLKPKDGKSPSAEIKMLNYSELGSVITNMLRLCILALEQDYGKNKMIDVGLILEQALHLFPTDEMELLDLVQEMLVQGA
ncbi:hypothetical protein [Flavobacterium phragmitis]|uniref:Uncharacterized protein n=1 Tax=Flavobacterium phragmitis TaxID=739143 RepID=A0A1I1PML7_9FLAO|nr:hypothetical protein [Flavobacterium phragmitis]SFD10972.1 hypothetical protein SAMN05216297_104254 [Flavobacterium phragmitis]